MEEPLASRKNHWDIIPGRPHSTGQRGHRTAIWVITVRNRAEIWVKSEKSLTESDLSVPALSLTKELQPLLNGKALHLHTERSNSTG